MPRTSTPEPEAIDVDTPPPSPIFFTEEPFDQDNDLQVTSPTKRARSSGTAVQHKKQKTKGTPHFEPPPDESIAQCYSFSEEPDVIYDETPPNGYARYALAVMEQLAGFYLLSSELYVVQGWDDKLDCMKNTWYHLQCVVAGSDIHVACVCPQGRGISQTPCVHEQYIQQHRQSILEEEGPILDGEKTVTLFIRQQGESGTYQNWFSVVGRQLGSHAVVVFDGDDAGIGSWLCLKDRELTCQHIVLAQGELQDILEADGKRVEEWHELNADQSDDHKTVAEVSISHRAIMPPLWCSLPTDPILYERPQPFEGCSEVIRLEKHARCSCGAEYNASLPISRIPCTIYGLLKAVDAEIEVQPCYTCDPRRRKFIGPDARELGLFNWSNQVLFTHDLLDEYTCVYSTSETPFAGWVSVLGSRFETHRSRHLFISVGLFRSAWFAFVRLQNFVDDMACTICGLSPKDIIWDSVTVAFSKKKLLPSLRPPTTTSDNSPAWKNVRYYPGQQLIPDHETRNVVLKALAILEQMRKQYKGHTSNTSEGGHGVAEDDEEILVDAEERLKQVNVGLGTVFAEKVGSLRGMTIPVPAYLEFFRQVCSGDTVLRIGTSSDMVILDEFLSNPTPFNTSHLISMPSLYHVLKTEQSGEGPYSPTFLGLVGWICSRAHDVLKHLVEQGSELIADPEIAGEPDKWQETGTYYSLPQIRCRPTYPNIRHERESGDRGGKCSKYYNEYGKDRLTGGIMAIWCTHVICYGFHCIPKSEGRNDVFSAMVTRWPQAPKHVIYDFACSLGPYCMLREPEFFANTKFLIDNFHTSNHTKCDRGWFLSSYSAVCPQLAKVNSSAAECGNSGLHRIRKSISYMSQGRAILYIKVFLSIWNRRKLKQM